MFPFRFMLARQTSPPDPNPHAAIRAADRADVLRELTEIGMDMARLLHGQMQALAEADPSPATATAKAEVALAFSRTARGVRQTLALDARLERGEQDRVDRALAGPPEIGQATGHATGHAAGRAAGSAGGARAGWTPPYDPQAQAAQAAKADQAYQKFRTMAELLRVERNTRRQEAARRAVAGECAERPDWHPRDEIDWDDENELPVQASLAEKFVGACLDLQVDPGDVLRRGGKAIYDLSSSDPYFTQLAELLGEDDAAEDEPELQACSQGPPESG